VLELYKSILLIDVWGRTIAVKLTSAFDNGGSMPVDGGRIVLINSVAYQRGSYGGISNS